jgi:hypothetical protein
MPVLLWKIRTVAREMAAYWRYSPFACIIHLSGGSCWPQVLEKGGVNMDTGVHSRGRVVVVVLALAGLLGPIAGLVLPQPVSGSPLVLSDLTPHAFLPIVMRPEPTPTPTPTPTPSPTPTSSPPPELAIYDKYGTLQNWDWLVSVFGPVSLIRGTDAAKVIELREAGPHSSLIVRVEDSYGNPIAGQEVVFYWSGAPLLQPYQRACGLDRGDVILTKDNGNAEFPMGTGSYYYPDRGEAGPHVVWIPRAGTDCLHGLGMIAGTDHTHLDTVWRLP